MDDRHGARMHGRFDPARAAILDDPARFAYLPAGDVLEMLALPRGGILLDFGTGTGAYALELARRRPDATVLALDEQPEMLAHLIAKLAASPQPNVRPIDGAALSPWREAVDRVLALNVLHELGDAALSSLVALLARDATALFIDWNAAIERDVGPPRDRVYTSLEARDRLASAGLVCTAERSFPNHYALATRRV